MTNTHHKRKSGKVQAAPAAPSGPSPKALRIVKENGRLVGLTVLGAILSIVIRFAPLTPLLVTAPIVPPLLRRVREDDRSAVTGAFWRWAVAGFLTMLVSTAFVRDRVFSSLPFASHSVRAMEQAITGAGGAPVGLAHIVVGTLAFAGLAAASLGIAACVLLSIALGTAAAGAAVLFAHGNNVLLISLVACPPWLWGALAAAVIGFAPAVSAGGGRWYHIGPRLSDREWLRRRAIIAGGLLLLAIVLRLAAAGPYLSLIHHWTVT